MLAFATNQDDGKCCHLSTSLLNLQIKGERNTFVGDDVYFPLQLRMITTHMLEGHNRSRTDTQLHQVAGHVVFKFFRTTDVDADVVGSRKPFHFKTNRLLRQRRVTNQFVVSPLSVFDTRSIHVVTHLHIPIALQLAQFSP